MKCLNTGNIMKVISQLEREELSYLQRSGRRRWPLPGRLLSVCHYGCRSESRGRPCWTGCWPSPETGSAGIQALLWKSRTWGKTVKTVTDCRAGIEKLWLNSNPFPLSFLSRCVCVCLCIHTHTQNNPSQSSPVTQEVCCCVCLCTDPVLCLDFVILWGVQGYWVSWTPETGCKPF